MRSAFPPAPVCLPCATTGFRPLAVGDLEMLHGWLNRPHVIEHYQKTPTTLDEVIEKFGPRTRGERPIHDHVAMLDGQPIGKFQCYRNADWPQHIEETELADGISVDLFIAEGTLLGKGLGRRLLASYVRDFAFPLHPGETACYICHEIHNERARRCSRAAGFQPLRVFVDQDGPSEISMVSREAIAVPIGITADLEHAVP